MIRLGARIKYTGIRPDVNSFSVTVAHMQQVVDIWLVASNLRI